MSEQPRHEADMVRAAIDAIVAQVLRQYRVSEAEARTLVGEAVQRNHALRRATGSVQTTDQLIRTRAFKDAATVAKKHVYYSLRRYRPVGADTDSAVAELQALPSDASAEARASAIHAIAEAHRSTAERLPTLDAFHAELFARIGQPGLVLDIGCGVQPLLFPFDGPGQSVERYVALDRDRQALAAVEAYARLRGDVRLTPLESDLSTPWDDLLRPLGIEQFDVALMLKLVGVLDRQVRDALPMLARTPAKVWVMSGSKVALAKQRDIGRRERGVLRRFARTSGRPVRDEYEVGDEFFLVLGPVR